MDSLRHRSWRPACAGLSPPPAAACRLPRCAARTSTATECCSLARHPQGLDKYENEDLIKHSLPHDVWFHVDALSSAHVYLRPPEGACPPASLPLGPLPTRANWVHVS